MRILHTSDWHLGKRLMDRERLPEQAAALNEIISVCEREQVDLVLVAGDVFDTFLPPAEAEELFYSAVKRMAGETRAVVVISGNHDDGIRLAASAPLAAENGVYLFGGKNRVPTGGDRPVHAVSGGENWLILQKGEERVYLNLLPYPNESRLREERTEETYQERTLRWITAGDEHYDGTMPHILLSHLFVVGGRTSDSERDIALGGARAVPIENFPSFGYTALGHLHKKQSVKLDGVERVRYSGSLLQYSFDEAGTEKSVVLLETEGNTVAVKGEIPLTAGRKLVRLEARSVEDAVSILKRAEGAYVELTLHLNAPLSSVETAALREANEGLVSLLIEVGTAAHAEIERRAGLDAGELFKAYYRLNYGGKEPSEELLHAFLEVMEEPT